MGTKSSALVNSRSRAERNLHLAQWTAQLVIGLRALRQMVDDASPIDEASVHGASFGSVHRRALPAFGASHGDGPSSSR